MAACKGLASHLRSLAGSGRAPASLTASRGFFGAPKDRPRVSQSKVLSGDDGPLFHLEMHRIKPEYMEDYIELAGEHILRISESDQIPRKLVGAWRTMIGPVKDQITHIWKHNSYNSIAEVQELLNNDKVWLEFRKKRNKMIDRRSNQIVLPFTFWNMADPNPNPSAQQKPKGLYEMRSYTLRPGTLIEWGQAWQKGINYRRDEAVGGWFSQIGEMHQVHHLWAYKDLEDRNEVRQAAWEFPGWDECVMKTGRAASGLV